MSEKEIMNLSKQKFTSLLELLGIEAEMALDVVEMDEGKYLDVKLTVAEGGAELIGKYGRVLDSLSVVFNILIPRDQVDVMGIWLDINGYREERKVYIEELTKKTAQQALMNHQSVELLPMKPWERRVVHMTVQKLGDVVSESIGDRDDRRVVIKPA